MKSYKEFNVGDIVLVPFTEDRLKEGKILNIVKTVDKGIMLLVENVGLICPYDVVSHKP